VCSQSSIPIVCQPKMGVLSRLIVRRSIDELLEYSYRFLEVLGVVATAYSSGSSIRGPGGTKSSCLHDFTCTRLATEVMSSSNISVKLT
jgi:hypothetical protein